MRGSCKCCIEVIFRNGNTGKQKADLYVANVPTVAERRLDLAGVGRWVQGRQPNATRPSVVPKTFLSTMSPASVTRLQIASKIVLRIVSNAMSAGKYQDSRREGATFLAVNPIDGQHVPVMIKHAKMQETKKRGMGAIREMAQLVPDTLIRPTAIFEGIRSDGDESRDGDGARCYCGTPEVAFTPDGSPRKPRLGRVFLVFVTADGVAYNWRWDLCDSDDPKLPVDHATRFHKRAL